MSNVLIITLPVHGHINPMLGLAYELVQKGEKVSAYSTERFRPMWEEKGVTVINWPLQVGEIKTESQLFVELAYRLMQYTCESYAHLEETCLQGKYDYIIVDFLCIWGKHLL